MPKDTFEIPDPKRPDATESEDTRPKEISRDAYKFLREAPLPSEFREAVRAWLPPMGISPSGDLEDAPTSPRIDMTSIELPIPGGRVQPVETSIPSVAVSREEIVPSDRSIEALYLTDMTLNLSECPHLTPGLSSLTSWPLTSLVTNNWAAFWAGGQDSVQANGDDDVTPPPDEELSPDIPEEIGFTQRAALVLHCGGKGKVIYKGGSKIFGTRNTITDHTDQMYLRLSQSFLFDHDEITYLSPFFDPKTVQKKGEFPLRNKDGNREDLKGVVELDGLNTRENVEEFFARVRDDAYDEVFVYIQGHGNQEEKFRNDGKFELFDKDDKPIGSITFKMLGEWIMGIQADHIGVAVDTCYSGQLAPFINKGKRKRHLLVAMSADDNDLSFGDEEFGYHKIIKNKDEKKGGDWSDLFIVNFQRLKDDDDKVDVATYRAHKAIGTDSRNATPRKAPKELLGH